MDAFRVFDIIFVTTGGGPGDATNSLMVYGVKQGLQFFNIGFASAIGNVAILCIAVLCAAFTPADPPRRCEGQRDMKARTRQIAIERTTLVVILALYMIPVLWLVSTAYKPPREIFSSPPSFTFSPTLSQFRAHLPVVRRLAVAEVEHRHEHLAPRCCRCCCSACRPAMRWRGRNRAFAIVVAYFFLAIRTVPIIATLIPFYLMMRDIGLLGTWWAVILINTTLNCAFVTWMMFSYFRALAARHGGGGADRWLHALGRVLPRRPADRGAGHHRQRAVLHHVLVE